MTESPTRGLKRGKDKGNKTDPVEFRKNHAVIIGIDKYSNGIAPLATAVNDASRLAEILEKQYDYNITLLVDEVTRSRLQALFQKELPGQVDPNDRLLIYFAGHGVALDGDNGPEGYLIPQDASLNEESFWPMTELHKALDDLPCRHMLAILDCCFAGAFRWSSTRDLQPLPPVIYKERYERFLRDPAWQVLTSAAYNQKALDTLSGYVVGTHGVAQEEENPHSPFALSLFEALHGAADSTPKDGDGIITATELYLYLRDQVEVNAEQLIDHRQTPGLWPLNKHRQGEFIFLLPDYDLDLPPAPDLTEENNPYKGLSSYEKGDCKLFFGRTDLIKELQQQVQEQSFTVVLGASGTGKSSLVKAGLLPALENNSDRSEKEADAVRASCWFILEKILRPGANPLTTLRSLLITELPGVRPERKEGATTAGLIGQWRKKHSGQKLLLVIDQFEEIITLCQEEQEREVFINELMDALEEHNEVLRVVLTLRSDFEAQIAQNYLKEWWQEDNRFVVPPMTQDELREVIEQPASVMVLYFEPRELVDRLINEVIQTPGALPLLSFTLSELYRRYIERQKNVEQQDSNRALTEADYEDIGGVIGSLRRRIDNEYEKLPDAAHKETMKRIMLRMVAFEGGELTRRRVPIWEFDYPDAAENNRVQTIRDRLLEVRLIVGGKSETPKGETESYVEPAHDALIVAWDKLRIWRDNEAETMLLQRKITQAAADWETGGRKTGELPRWDSRLQRMEILSGKERFALNKIEGEFLQAAKALAEKEEQEKKEQERREREALEKAKEEAEKAQKAAEETALAQRGKTKAARIGATIAVILLTFAVIFWFSSEKQKKIAITEKEKAEANLRRVEAIQLATESEAISSNTEKLFYSWSASGGARNEIEAPSFTEPLRLARDSVLKTLKKDKYVTREAFDALRQAVETAPPWKAALPMDLKKDDIISPSSVAWSPDGNFLTAVSPHSDVVVWNTAGDKNIEIYRTRIKDDEWSDEWFISWCGNTHFMVSGAGNIVQLFDTQSINSPKIISKEADSLAACNLSGTQILLRMQSGLYLSQMNNIEWKHVTNLPKNTRDFSFSPDDSYLYFISDEGLHIQSLTNKKEKYFFSVEEGEQIINATWSSDQKNLRLFAIKTKYCASRDELEDLPEAEIDFVTIELTRSGFTQKSISNKDIQKIQSPSLFCEANKIVFSPDEQWIATAHGDCSFGLRGSSCENVAIRVWNAESIDLVREMYGHISHVKTISWHPDSHALASGGIFDGGAGNVPDTRVLIWEIKPLWDIAGWEDSSLLTLPYAGFLSTDLWGKDKEYIEGGWLSTAFWEKNKESLKIALTRGGCTACSYQESDLYLISWTPSSWSWDSNGWKWSEVGSPEKPNNPKGKTVDLDELLSDPRSPDGKKELFWLNKGSTMPAYSEESWEEDWAGDGNKKKNEEPNVVRITDYETRKTLRLQGHESWVSTAEWSPDGKRILTSSSDNTVRIWDVESGREMARYELDVYTFARATWSQDGKWILVGYPDVIIWPADVDELLNRAESLIKTLDGENALAENEQ